MEAAPEDDEMGDAAVIKCFPVKERKDILAVNNYILDRRKESTVRLAQPRQQ